jgi:ribonuclease Z
MNLTLTGYSTALFSTWYFVEELGLLLDCGDGVCSSLLQKSRKVEHVFISHADRDHLTGLLQFHQLNARNGVPSIHYPKDSGSFPALQQFLQKFDPHIHSASWNPYQDEEKIWIRKDMYLHVLRNNHVPAENSIMKSAGCKVVQRTQKLRDEYRNLSGNEVKDLINVKGKTQLMQDVETIVLAFSGDTPCENMEKWNHAEVLIHEATFLAIDSGETIQTHGNKHSSLDQVLKAVSQLQIGKLVLGHFSSRYSNEHIDESIRNFCQKYSIEFPVYRVLPGQVVRNILQQNPVYNAS